MHEELDRLPSIQNTAENRELFLALQTWQDEYEHSWQDDIPIEKRRETVLKIASFIGHKDPKQPIEFIGSLGETSYDKLIYIYSIFSICIYSLPIETSSDAGYSYGIALPPMPTEFSYLTHAIKDKLEGSWLLSDSAVKNKSLLPDFLTWYLINSDMPEKNHSQCISTITDPSFTIADLQNLQFEVILMTRHRTIPPIHEEWEAP